MPSSRDHSAMASVSSRVNIPSVGLLGLLRIRLRGLARWWPRQGWDAREMMLRQNLDVWSYAPRRAGLLSPRLSRVWVSLPDFVEMVPGLTGCRCAFAR